jgi:hypothetical protein
MIGVTTAVWQNKDGYDPALTTVERQNKDGYDPSVDHRREAEEGCWYDPIVDHSRQWQHLVPGALFVLIYAAMQ